jgi:hypothetical protein
MLLIALLYCSVRWSRRRGDRKDPVETLNIRCYADPTSMDRQALPWLCLLIVLYYHDLIIIVLTLTATPPPSLQPLHSTLSHLPLLLLSVGEPPGSHLLSYKQPQLAPAAVTLHGFLSDYVLRAPTTDVTTLTRVTSRTRNRTGQRDRHGRCLIDAGSRYETPPTVTLSRTPFFAGNRSVRSSNSKWKSKHADT